MSNYLYDRFPLDRTSTVYMTGKGVFNLVKWGKPGVIAAVELHPDAAETFCEAVWEALADAWDQGVAAANAATSDFSPENPFRTQDQERPI